MVRLTGERPVQGATPDSLIALHAAGYREVIDRLGPGVVVDVGCGTGAETTRMAGPGRYVIGIDYSAQTVVDAGRSHTGELPVRFVGMDGGRLALRDASVDWLVSSHIIEHFTNPVAHVAELARVLRPSGSAFVVTPNAPADFENPFHVYPFDPDELRSMLGLFFEDVECLGLEGDDVLRADLAARRVKGDRILALDVLRLRHRMPRRWYVWTYERVLPLVYRMLGRRNAGIGSGIDHTHLFVSPDITPTTPVLFAVARRPRRRAGEG